MRELVLPNLPDLIELECENSSWDKDAGLGRYLESIDLRGAPNLRWLNCFCNALEQLNLSCVPQLRELNCAWNPISELDLSCVPYLEALRCESYQSDSIGIKTLDIRSLFHLKELRCDRRTEVIQRPEQHF